jgi:Bacterial self-protective colicin-like immunity
MMRDMLQKYKRLIDKFHQKMLDIEEFKAEYFNIFLVEHDPLNEREYHLTNEIFLDLEAMTADEELMKTNPSYFVSEDQVRLNVKKYRKMMDELSPKV